MLLQELMQSCTRLLVRHVQSRRHLKDGIQLEQSPAQGAYLRQQQGRDDQGRHQQACGCRVLLVDIPLDAADLPASSSVT